MRARDWSEVVCNGMFEGMEQILASIAFTVRSCLKALQVGMQLRVSV